MQPILVHRLPRRSTQRAVEVRPTFREIGPSPIGNVRGVHERLITHAGFDVVLQLMDEVDSEASAFAAELLGLLQEARWQVVCTSETSASEPRFSGVKLHFPGDLSGCQPLRTLGDCLSSMGFTVSAEEERGRARILVGPSWKL